MTFKQWSGDGERRGTSEKQDGDCYRVNEAKKIREIREIAARDKAISSELLERVVDRLVQAFNPESIILYGSYAEGMATRDSDLDFLVITSQPITWRDEQERLRGSFNDVPIPVQVMTISKQKFEETRDVIGGIAYPAGRYGKVIYTGFG